MKINSKTAQAIYTFMPTLKAVENVALLGNTTIPGMEELIEKVSGAKDDYDGLEQILQTLSRWVGIKFKEADMEELKDELRNQVYYDAMELRKAGKKYSAGAQVRSAQAKESLDKTKRKVVGW